MNDSSFLRWKIQDACMRMQCARDPAEKLKWAKVMNAARRERGDFDDIIETKREKLDQPGERYD